MTVVTPGAAGSARGEGAEVPMGRTGPMCGAIPGRTANRLRSLLTLSGAARDTTHYAQNGRGLSRPPETPSAALESTFKNEERFRILRDHVGDSIVWFKLLRAHGGCLGVKSR